MPYEDEVTYRDPCYLKRIPVELREEIYGHLLRLQPSDRKDRSNKNIRFCYPAILRTCRFVYEEALPLLGRENTLQFEIWDGYWKTEDHEHHYEGHGWPGWHVTMSGHCFEDALPLSKECARVDIEKCEAQCDGSLGLPSCIRYAQKLKFHIRGAVHQPKDWFSIGWIPYLPRANHVLFIFALALSGNDSLEEVDICLEDKTWQSCVPARDNTPSDKMTAIARGLYPLLSGLKPEVELNLKHIYLQEIDCRGQMNGEEQIPDPRATLLRSHLTLNHPPEPLALVWCWNEYCRLQKIAADPQMSRLRSRLEYIWNVDSFGNPGFYDTAFITEVRSKLEMADRDLKRMQAAM